MYLDLHCALIVAISVQLCIPFLLPVALMERDMLQNRACSTQAGLACCVAAVVTMLKSRCHVAVHLLYMSLSSYCKAGSTPCISAPASAEYSTAPQIVFNSLLNSEAKLKPALLLQCSHVHSESWLPTL